MLIIDKYQNQIAGIISCYDRVIIQGSLSNWGYSEGMTAFLFQEKIKIFDFVKFAQTLRDELIRNINSICQINNIEIVYIKKPRAFSKDEYVHKIIVEKNITEGLVVIFSVLEHSISYEPRVDKIKHHYFLRFKEMPCLHYYIYFIDKEYGLCFLRIPTYVPFRLEFYFNGHNLLESKLKKQNIECKIMRNAFVDIKNLPDGQSGFQRAQELSDNIRVEDLHKFLDILSERYLPFLKKYNQSYRWVISQAEYSTDIIFKKQEDFQTFYQDIIYKTVLSVKPDNISTFLGKKLVSSYQGETGNNFINTRILGTRIKHRKGSNQIKLYDKLGIILRIETTVNNVTDFNHYRKIISKDGKERFGVAKMKKSIYSLYALGEILKNANHRYLEFISEIEDNSQGVKNLFKVSDLRK